MWHKSSILVICCHAPLVRRVVLEASQSGSVRQPGELRLVLWCTETFFFRDGANVCSESSSSCLDARPLYSISGTVGFVMVGALLSQNLLLATTNHLQLGLLFAGAAKLGFSEVSRASKKAVMAVSITVSSRASRGCSGQNPAVAAP